MDDLPLLLGIMSATLFLATFNAWRHGNERRDLAALGTLGGLFGVGTAFFALA